MALSTVKQLILTGLLDIRDNGPKDENIGICSNLSDYVFDNADSDKFKAEHECGLWTKEMFPLWPKFSGDVNYPVPAPKWASKNPLRAYSSSVKWKFQYGALRYELVDFLIAQLVEEDRKA